MSHCSHSPVHCSQVCTLSSLLPLVLLRLVPNTSSNDDMASAAAAAGSLKDPLVDEETEGLRR